MSGAIRGRFSWLELVHKPQIGRVHVAHVVYAPTQERQSVQPHAECETAVFFRVDTRVLQYIGMHHARTHHLYPPVAQLGRRALAYESHIIVDRRLGERKEARTELYFDGYVFSSGGGSAFGGEKFPEESLERTFEIGKRDVFPHGQTFYLEKFRFIRHVRRLVAEYFAGDNNAIWRLNALLHLRFHVAHLHGRGVRTQHHAWFVFDEKSILHIAGGMVLGHIECVKIVPLVFKERAFGTRESHVEKYLVGFADERRYGVNVPTLHNG